MEYHKKMLSRWADIYLAKEQKEGPAAANEYAQRTFNSDIVKLLVPIVMAKRGQRK